MPQRILTPLDGSSIAHSVLPHLIAFTRVNGTEVTLVHVLESYTASLASGRPLSAFGPDPVDWQLRKAEAQTYLEEVAGQLRPFGLNVQIDVLEGPPADRIIDYAQRHNYDMIALSSHGNSGLSGWSLSSVAHKVIQRARKSILLAPAYHSSALAGQEQNGPLDNVRYRRILAPLDGSPRAECILNKASALARYFEAQLVLAHVVTRPYLIQRMPLTNEDQVLIQQVVERNRLEAERYFDQLQGRIGLTPQIHILEGAHVPTTITTLIEQEDIDLVVLSAHGHVYEDKRPYGNLANHLITYGAVPLMVCQDLMHHEIEPTRAELAFNTLEFKVRKHMSPPQQSIAA
jgi:nucleotide-binding universal stress UspA family protein